MVARAGWGGGYEVWGVGVGEGPNAYLAIRFPQGSLCNLFGLCDTGCSCIYLANSPHHPDT